VRAGKAPVADKVVDYAPTLAARLGGVDLPDDEQRRILAALGFAVSGEGVWKVAVPGWRPDIDGAPDIVEEVIRVTASMPCLRRRCRVRRALPSRPRPGTVARAAPASCRCRARRA
jgi:hypothetical protein